MSEDKKRTDKILKEYIGLIENIYGCHLRKVILYGSYARGDYRADSDIDIMILLDYSDEEIKRMNRKLSDITFDINFDNNTDIKPITVNEDHFNKWL